MMTWDTTMFHFWVNVVQRKVSMVAQRAVFGVAGPVSSLLRPGWRTRLRSKSTTALPLLSVAA